MRDPGRSGEREVLGFRKDSEKPRERKEEFLVLALKVIGKRGVTVNESSTVLESALKCSLNSFRCFQHGLRDWFPNNSFLNSRRQMESEGGISCLIDGQ